MNISKNIGYKDYLTYTDSQKYNILIKREEEIERLNNIINELEKDIENKIHFVVMKQMEALIIIFVKFQFNI